MGEPLDLHELNDRIDRLIAHPLGRVLVPLDQYYWLRHVIEKSVAAGEARLLIADLDRCRVRQEDRMSIPGELYQDMLEAVREAVYGVPGDPRHTYRV